MDERFLAAWCERPHKVLGRKLQPFSLAHRLALEAMGSPLLLESAPFGISDLLLAVRVCASRRPMVSVTRPTWIERVRFWHGFFSPTYFRAESERFVAYMDDYSHGPKFWNRMEGSFSRESVPWVLDVVATLLRHTSLSEEKVWAMPLGRALWYFTALRKQEGADLDVLTTDEERMLDQLAEEAAP